MADELSMEAPLTTAEAIAVLEQGAAAPASELARLAAFLDASEENRAAVAAWAASNQDKFNAMHAAMDAAGGDMAAKAGGLKGWFTKLKGTVNKIIDQVTN